MWNDEQEYTGQTGDPLHDAIYGWDLGSSSTDGNEDGNIRPRKSKSDYDVIDKARQYSLQGNHLKAIEYCERARGGFKSKVLMVFIAREYEAMGDYNYALSYWNEICDEFFNNYDVFEGKADLLYHLGRYDDAITCYKKALTLLENSGKKSQLEFSRLNNSISNTFNALGKSHIAGRYKESSKQFTDDFVSEKMEIANRYYNQGAYSNARKFYKMVLKHDTNNVKAKNRVHECERILSLSIEERNKLREKAKEKFKREEEERKKREKRKKRENERIVREKRMREFEEQQRKRKEECERNPDCIKKEITHFKKKVLKDYYLLLHFDHYQNKSDIKFKEILEYEELLEKLGVKESYSREDLKTLKNENKRIKYILSHVDNKYRGNGVKLFVKNQKKINELEKRYPEKGFIKSIINVVFDDSEDIATLEVESSVWDKIQKADKLSKESSDHKNVNLQEATNLVNQANVELSGYLRNKNPNQYPHLLNLKIDIDNLERKINRKIENLINSEKRRLFLIDRDKYSHNHFECRLGDDLKLVKEDGEDIVTVFYKNEPVGIVSNKLNSDFEKQFYDTSQLQYLPKNTDAKYYFKYGRFEILEIEDLDTPVITISCSNFRKLVRYNIGDIINVKYRRDNIRLEIVGTDNPGHVYVDLDDNFKLTVVKDNFNVIRSLNEGELIIIKCKRMSEEVVLKVVNGL